MSASFSQNVADAFEGFADLDLITALGRSHQCRKQLLMLASDLSMSDDPDLRQAVQRDEQQIMEYLRDILLSDSDRKAVLDLEGEDAQWFMDLIQEV